MPKIFLIKNRLHQQQLKLLESQNLLAAKNDLGLGDRDEDDSRSGDGQNEPLSLVSRNRERDNHDSGKFKIISTFFILLLSNSPTSYFWIVCHVSLFLRTTNFFPHSCKVLNFKSVYFDSLSVSVFFGAELSLVLKE